MRPFFLEKVMSVNKHKQEFEQLSNDGKVVHSFYMAEHIEPWFQDFDVASRELFDDRHRVLQDNKKFMLDKFGRQLFTTTDSAARRLYCWKFDCEQGCFWILTAPDRGTTIELYHGESDVRAYADSFKQQLCSIFELQYLGTANDTRGV